MAADFIDTIDFSKYGSVDAEAVDFGYFETDKYPDGTLVADVATYNEFGTRTIPERPFFRNALTEISGGALRRIADEFVRDDFNLRERGAEAIGVFAAAEVGDAAVDLRTPPNAPATVARKGSTNPLVDTGVLSGDVTAGAEGAPGASHKVVRRIGSGRGAG